jgi:hypothetical protein
MWRVANVTYADSVETNTAIAAGTDHQILAAMTGRPTSSQEPTILVSIPLALRSANQSGMRFTTGSSQSANADV